MPATCDRDLHAALIEAKQTHSPTQWSIPRSSNPPNELIVTTPKMYSMYLKQPDLKRP